MSAVTAWRQSSEEAGIRKPYSRVAQGAPSLWHVLSKLGKSAKCLENPKAETSVVLFSLLKWAQYAGEVAALLYRFRVGEVSTAQSICPAQQQVDMGNV